MNDWFRFYTSLVLSFPFWLVARLGKHAKKKHDQIMWWGERARFIEPQITECHWLCGRPEEHIGLCAVDISDIRIAKDK